MLRRHGRIMIRCRKDFFNSYPRVPAALGAGKGAVGAVSEEAPAGAESDPDDVAIVGADAAAVPDAAPETPRKSSRAASVRSNASELCGSDEVSA